MILDGPSGSYNGQTCFVTGYDNNSTQTTNYDSAILEDTTGFGHSIDLPMQGGASNLVIRMTRDTNTLFCRIKHDTTMDDSVPFVPRGSNAAWPTGGLVGIMARKTAADVHYVIVYASS